MSTPQFSEQFPELDQFILDLVAAFRSGDIQSWDNLGSRVMDFFTPERMDEMEACIHGWKKMSSYNEGVTLVHVMCVFMGLFMLPEFERLSLDQQNLMKWVILWHDVEKAVEKGKRDPVHGFRSAVSAARNLPSLGFDTTPEYIKLIDTWSEFTYAAITTPDGATEPIQDNRKLPEILAGIHQLFGKNSPAALIVKTILLHLSIDVVSEWPQAAPLSQVEISQYVDLVLLPLLMCMALADNEGWSIFYPEYRAVQRQETLEAFETIQGMIS